MTDKLR